MRGRRERSGVTQEKPMNLTMPSTARRPGRLVTGAAALGCPTVLRPFSRLIAFISLALLLTASLAAAASARGYFDGGAVLADSPTTVANDGTVYALRVSAADVPDQPGTPYPTPALEPNQTYYVKIRLTTNWQSGEPASTDNRGFMWNGAQWVFWGADWAEFPTVTTDAFGNISPDQWFYFKFSDTTKTGKYGLLVSLSMGGTGSTLNGRTWQEVAVYDPKTSGGWVHAGAATGSPALTPLRVYSHTASGDPVSTAVTEANACDDDSNGVIDDEQPGPVKTGGLRAGVPTGQALDVSLDGALWPGLSGFTLTVPDTDIAQGASDQTAPTAPSSLSAAPRNGAVLLTWSAASDLAGVTGYRIYRWTAAQLGSTYTADAVPIAKVGAITTYTDATAANGKTYYYLVRALDAATNAGPRSPTASATPDGTPPGPATSLVATSGDGQVTLSWSKPADADLAGVKIMRKTGATAPTGPSDGKEVYDGTATSFTDKGLTNGQLYSYAAFAYDTALNYAPASTASATPNVVTKLTFTVKPAIVAWAGAWTFSGALTTSAGAPVPDLPADLEQSTDGGATWHLVAHLQPTPGTGTYSGPGPVLVQTTRLHLVYTAGDGQHLASTSIPVTVATRVALATPAAPTRVGLKKSFNATGSLAPQPTSGLSVKVRCYQLVRRSWRLKKTVAATLATADAAGRYAARVSLPSRGSWKLVAFVPATAKFAATTSGARRLTVR
jgi:hypothetical protein